MSRKIWVLVIVGVIGVALTLSIGLFVKLQSVAAAKRLVETLSKGRYAFEATKIKVDPFSMVLMATDLKIKPTHPGESNNEFELKADSVPSN